MAECARPRAQQPDGTSAQENAGWIGIRGLLRPRTGALRGSPSGGPSNKRPRRSKWGVERQACESNPSCADRRKSGRITFKLRLRAVLKIVSIAGADVRRLKFQSFLA
jgi:hypothetical protein